MLSREGALLAGSRLGALWHRMREFEVRTLTLQDRGRRYHIDPIDRIFINGEMNLRSYGSRALASLRERVISVRKARARESACSPENFRKIKAELRRLKGTIKMLEISLNDTTANTLQKKDWMITDQKNSSSEGETTMRQIAGPETKKRARDPEPPETHRFDKQGAGEEKHVRKKLQTELERALLSRNRSGARGAPDRRKWSGDGPRARRPPSCPCPRRRRRRASRCGGPSRPRGMSEPPSPIRQRPVSRDRPASRARTPAAESEGSPYFPDADHDPLLRVSRPPSYDDYVDEEPRVIIQRDVRVEEALKKQAKEYKAKCRRERDEAWWPLSLLVPTARRRKAKLLMRSGAGS